MAKISLKTVVAIAICFCACFTKIKAQEFTTEGKEFWFGFLENTLGSPPDTLIVSMSSRFNTTATVSIPLNGWTQTVNIPANTSITVGIPRTLAMASGCGTKSPMGCRIVASEKISAYALNFQGYSADATLLIPNPTLGDKYYLNTYRENYSNSRQTQMLIVAAYPNTTIEITPTVATQCGNPANAPFQITMNQGEVYFLDAAGDLTGTYVRSVDVGQGCKKFVLFSGSFCTAVGNQCCCDHLYDINFYNDSWGQNYILPRLATRGTTRFRAVAQTNGTQLSVNGGPLQNLNAGQFYQFDLTANGSLTSNNPVEVMQLSMSGQFDNVTNSDPFMINLGPNEQTLNEITFNTLFNSGNNPSYYVTIVTKTANTNLLTLDGGPVGGFTPVASNPTYSVSSPSIALGSHTIRSDSGFLAYVYEYAGYESFGYSAGANLSNLFASFTYASANFDTIFCPGDTVLFQGIGDPAIVSYEWDFGDGDTAIGRTPKHVYDSLGRYDVKMIILRQNSCEKDTIPGAVNIIGPSIVQVPDDTICIGSSLTISTTASNPNDTIKWSTGAVGSSITITPPATTSYNVFAVSNKCPGLRDTFTIFVNDPKVDFTTSPICFGNPTTFYPSAQAAALMFLSWDFGDGNTISYGSALLNYTTHTYANPGTYQVTLAIIDSVGCSDTITKPVNVFPLINSDFNVNDVCFNGSVSVINNTTIVNGGFTSQWLWGDSTAIDTIFAPTHVYADTGTYNITYIAVSDSGCSDTLVKPVTVFPLSVADFTTSDTCLGNQVLFINNSSAPPGTIYQWNFGDGQQSNDSIPTHLYQTADSFYVTLVTATPQGCNDTISKAIIIFPKPLVDFASDSACFGQSLTFNNNSSIAWGSYTSTWDFGNGDSSSQISPTYLYADTGNYSVQLMLISDKNCADSLTKIARIHPNPDALFTVSDVCNDSTLIPVNSSSISTGTISYVWSFGDGGVSTLANPSHKYTSTGNYNISVSVTSAFGCVDTQSANATVILGAVLNFTAPDVCEGVTTIFTDSTVLKTGTTISNYTWTFGDGNTANTQNATNSYAAVGTYNAELLLDFGNNCLDSITKQVFVRPNPVAAFTVNDVCNDSTLTPTNISSIASGNMTYTWTFGDGGTANLANPSHTYTSTGNFTIALTITSDFGCADTLSANATVILGANMDFTAPDVCEGFTTIFTDNTVLKTGTTINNYLWTFGDGNSANTQNATNTYTAAGTYNAKLIADFGNNCFDSISRQVTVNPNPTAAFTANTVCEQQYTQFTNQSNPANLSRSWQLGDGNTSTDANPLHLYASDGVYNATLIVTTPQQCSDTVTQSVTVLPVGNAAFTVAPVCFGFNSVFVNQTDSAVNSVSAYNWTLGDNTNSTAHTPVHRYAVDGSYNVRLITNFTNGCADTAIGIATVYPTPAMTFTSNNISCFSFNDGNITLTATKGSAPFSYSWNTGATTGALNNIPSGAYAVTFTDARGCVDSLKMSLTQPDSLSLSYLLDSISCRGLSDGKIEVFVSGGTPPYNYQWSNGASTRSINQLSANSYTITVSDNSLCELIRAILLPEPPKFTVALPIADTINLGESVTLAPVVPYSNVKNWLWTPATALNCVDCENPVSTPYTDIDYRLIAISEKGCRDTAFTRIYVEHTPVVYVPNMFSPNGDGLNDVAMVYANNVRDMDFLIFNRWGEKVYEGHSIAEGWNGLYLNKEQDPETYVYLVKVTFLDNQTVTKTGSITLVK